MSNNLATKSSQDDAEMDAIVFTNSRVHNRTALSAVGSTGVNGSSVSAPPSFCNGTCQHSRCALNVRNLKRQPSISHEASYDVPGSGVRAAPRSLAVMPWAEFQRRLERARSGDGEAAQRLLRDARGSFDSSQPSLSRTASSPNNSYPGADANDSDGRPQSSPIVSEETRCSMIATVVGSIEKSANDVNALEGLLHALDALAGEEVRRETIGQEGGLKAIFECLSHHQTSDAVQSVGLDLVASLCSESAANREIASICNGVGVLIGLLRSPERTKAKSVERILLAIYECCKDNEHSKKAAGESGGISVTLSAITSHRSEAGIQIHGLRVLEALARESADNMSVMRECGALDVILAAMRSESSCRFTHELATNILGTLLRDHEQTQIVLGVKNGVIDVVRALHLAAGSSTATMSACVCLRYLAFEEDNRRRMAACNGVQAMIEAAEQMKVFTTESITTVLLALGNATFDDPANKSAASKSGGVSTLVSIMAIHEDNVEVVEYVCRVLRNTSHSRQSTKKACYKQGAVAAVAAAMKNHVDIAGIQEHGAAMLINMLNGFPFAVRATKLDRHLAVTSDVHSLHEATFVQVDHLRVELEKQAMSSISSLLSRRSTGAVEPSSATSSMSASKPAPPLCPRTATRTPSSTCADDGLGRAQSAAAASQSRLSSFDSLHKPKISASRQSSTGTANASDYGAAMFSASEPQNMDELIEY